MTKQKQQIIIGLALLLASVGAWYFQVVLGLQPCPMCIVQRYILITMIGVWCLGWFLPDRWYRIGYSPFLGLVGVLGGFVAAKQSWLQWYPPKTVSCGRDFYGIIENFPIRDAFPMLLRGTGDCSKVDWSLFGLSIANYSFLFFAALAAWMLFTVCKTWKS
jgi:disulfide bond formation protein DsbB